MRSISLQESYEECRQLNKHYGTLFFHAINQFAKKDQPHVHALCAYLKILDEIVDSPNEGISKKHQEEAIQQFADALQEELNESYSPHSFRQAIVHTAKFHELESSTLKKITKAKIKDLKTKRYASYKDLQKHIDSTSGILAELLTHSIGYKHEKAFTYTKKLLRAGHLIEIICNISRDADLHDRIYLPQQSFKKHKATIEAIKRKRVTPELKTLLEEILQKAEKELTSFEKGLHHFPETTHKALHTTTQIYHGLIESIRKMNYNTFTRRPDIKWTHRLRYVLPF